MTTHFICSTFYLAGPSARRSLIRAMSQDLKAIGFEWENGWDWTELDSKANDKALENLDPAITRVAQVGLVSGDLLAAANADLFVAYVTPENFSPGTFMELGYRLAQGKQCVVVCQDEAMRGHLFFKHPLVTVHEHWTDLMFVLRCDGLEQVE